jgi:hypothetical protein
MVFVLRMDRLGCGGGVAGVGDCAAAGARRDPDPDDKVASFTKCPQRFLRRIFPLSAKLSRRLKKAQPVTVVLSLLNLVTIVALATVCVMFLWTDKVLKYLCILFIFFHKFKKLK